MPSSTTSSLPNDPCGVLEATSVFQGRWKGAVIWWLNQRPHHFGELRRALAGVTPKVLTRQLRELERDGLLTRATAPTRPPRVVYSLTPLGASLVPLFDALVGWWQMHAGEIEARRRSST
jgi:DNA-binding HxlR family transcriptional regulator